MPDHFKLNTNDNHRIYIVPEILSEKVVGPFKFLYFHLLLFFSLSAVALELDPRQTLKFMTINSLNKNLMKHFVDIFRRKKGMTLTLCPLIEY